MPPKRRPSWSPQKGKAEEDEEEPRTSSEGSLTGSQEEAAGIGDITPVHPALTDKRIGWSKEESQLLRMSARAQLLKEADSRSNQMASRRGAVWSARAARARSTFWAPDFDFGLSMQLCAQQTFQLAISRNR
eukprot:SAG25_NODE_196_length_12129_cov_57.802826_9_plen_132_part_00